MGLAVSRIVLVAALAASLAACGRAGDPEKPKAAAATAQPGVEGAKENDKPFILDPLI